MVRRWHQHLATIKLEAALCVAHGIRVIWQFRESGTVEVDVRRSSRGSTHGLHKGDDDAARIVELEDATRACKVLASRLADGLVHGREIEHLGRHHRDLQWEWVAKEPCSRPWDRLGVRQVQRLRDANHLMRGHVDRRRLSPTKSTASRLTKPGAEDGDCSAALHIR